MDKLSKLTKTNVNKLSTEIIDALADLGNKYGVEFKLGNGTYNAVSFDVKLHAALTSDEAENTIAERVNNLGRSAGFDCDIYGAKFTSRASTYTITDYDVKKIKYPIIATNQNGTSYKFAAQFVKRALASSK